MGEPKYCQNTGMIQTQMSKRKWNSFKIKRSPTKLNLKLYRCEEFSEEKEAILEELEELFQINK